MSAILRRTRGGDLTNFPISGRRITFSIEKKNACSDVTAVSPCAIVDTSRTKEINGMVHTFEVLELLKRGEETTFDVTTPTGSICVPRTSTAVSLALEHISVGGHSSPRLSLPSPSESSLVCASEAYAKDCSVVPSFSIVP
ncbi:hypothetical protein AVEN_135826-1 [Araneus ventricosus]|uniref:Uncharacterized protein n=1 Tax=Araneus ventricosus TaxID=182803 RepID=A0A4Y2SXZ9_ARAVE|nr:hypothetical protein AVEN_135826-1 [Araneus ventricosus]